MERKKLLKKKNYLHFTHKLIAIPIHFQKGQSGPKKKIEMFTHGSSYLFCIPEVEIFAVFM